MTVARRTRGRSTALATDEELWGAVPPKQARGAEAIQRIAVAGQALFSERDYDDVSIADIMATAEMSVGNFYTRFSSKEHLVLHLMGELAEELRARMQREMSPERMAGRSVAEVVRRYLVLMADTFVEHRGLLRPATLIARQTRDEKLQALMRRFNDDVHGRFRALLLDRLGPGAPEAMTTRVDLAILWCSAAMREVLLYGEPVSSLSRQRALLIDELTRSVALSLETDRDA